MTNLTFIKDKLYPCDANRGDTLYSHEYIQDRCGYKQIFKLVHVIFIV